MARPAASVIVAPRATLGASSVAETPVSSVRRLMFIMLLTLVRADRSSTGRIGLRPLRFPKRRFKFTQLRFRCRLGRGFERAIVADQLGAEIGQYRAAALGAARLGVDHRMAEALV